MIVKFTESSKKHSATGNFQLVIYKRGMCIGTLCISMITIFLILFNQNFGGNFPVKFSILNTLDPFSEPAPVVSLRVRETQRELENQEEQFHT